MSTALETVDSCSSLTDKVTLDAIGRTIVNDRTSKHLITIGEASNKNLDLIILPTERCNFRCTYCYEDFRAGRMKPDTIHAIKRLLEQRAGDLQALTISWFGGEPLIEKDTIFEISRYASYLTSEHRQLKYQGSMTTNGYFLDYQTATTLADCGVRSYQISLDGPSEVHNQSRLRADGGATFEQIWANLLAIRNGSLPVSVLLRIHFSADTVHLLDPLIEDIKRELLDDSRFSVAFKPIERLGGSNDAAIQVLSKDKKEQAVKSLTTSLFGEKLSLARNLSQLNGYVCYASRSNSLVIRSNGDIAKCTTALYDERNKIGTLQPNGVIQLIPGRLAPWLRGLETLDPKTLGCPFSTMSAKSKVFAVVAAGSSDDCGANKLTNDREAFGRAGS